MPPTIAHTFLVDVTPPVGDYLCGGLHTTSVGVEQPLYLRGLVLSSGANRYVVAGIDYCYLCGRSYHRLAEALAQGAGVPPSQVAIQANHVHDAPLIDEEAHALLEGLVPGKKVHNEQYFARVLDDARRAVAAALASPGTAVGSVAFSQHPVEQFASNRRVLRADGRCQVRWSVCRDEAVRSAPEGRVDPLVSQVVLYDQEKQPFTCLSFYTSHPQVSDGRRMISGDTVGLAMDLFEKTNPGVFPVYFTGCAGDITAGKYTTLNRHRNRLVFGLRLFDGIQGAFGKAAPRPLESIGWADHTITLPLRRGSAPEPVREHEQALRDPGSSVGHRYLAAMKVDRARRNITSYPFRLARLRLGEINLLFGPSELVIDYQFHAQARAAAAGQQLAMAAYGDSFLMYVANDIAFDQGGYEVDPMWSEVGKGIEAPIKKAIDAILATPI